MFLVMGIAGKVGGATAEHLLAHGKRIRALDAVNAGWMDLGGEGTEHVAGMTSPRDVFAAARRQH